LYLKHASDRVVSYVQYLDLDLTEKLNVLLRFTSSISCRIVDACLASIAV